MYVLGLDVGTTGCKAIIFTIKGDIISSAYGEYSLYHRKPEWSELNPKEVWETIIATIRASLRNKNIDPKLIIAIGASVLGDAFIPVDKNGNWLYMSMTTVDGRAAKQAQWWENNFGADSIYKITGQPLTSSMPIYPLQKIRWLRDNEPDVYKKTSMFLSWEDYLNLKLCGKAVGDFSVAARTMMFDITRKKWSDEILSAAGMDEAALPDVQPSGSVVGELSSMAAEETGLTTKTIVVTGGHDQPCGALGAGITETGPAMDATGTVECIGVVLSNLSLSNEMRLQGFAVHNYVIEDKFFLFGFNPTSGAVLRWYRDTFAEKEKSEAQKKGVNIYDLLTSMASAAPAGARELFLLPYFEGSGTPTFNRAARGVLLGLTISHGKNEVLRAILEGLTFELRCNVEEIEKQGTKIIELRAIGGGARSGFWLQLKADITRKKVVVPNVTEAAATGAAILASVGGGVYKTPEKAVKAIYKEINQFSPKSKAGKVYDKYYRIYRGLYGSLKRTFGELSDVREEEI